MHPISHSGMFFSETMMTKIIRKDFAAGGWPNLTMHSAILALLFCIMGGRADSAEVATRMDGDTCKLLWQGDERIQLSFSRSHGLLSGPSAIHVRVDEHELSFDGF